MCGFAAKVAVPAVADPAASDMAIASTHPHAAMEHLFI
jgi:hypothetical protein